VKTSVEVRPLELVATPGHTVLREVYELLGEKGSLTAEQATARDAFWEGVVALRQGDGINAKAKFTKAKLKDHDDWPLSYFLERAESLGKDKPHVVKSEQRVVNFERALSNSHALQHLKRNAQSKTAGQIPTADF